MPQRTTRTTSIPEGGEVGTANLIDYFRGNADEFAMLKCVLCLSYVMEGQDATRWKYFFNELRIVACMDEIRSGQ